MMVKKKDKKTVEKKVEKKKAPQTTKAKRSKLSKREMMIMVGLILLPLVIGGLASLLTGNAMLTFGELNQPPLAPPAWLFPVVWSILYLLMGYASYLIFRVKTKNEKEENIKRTEVCLYLVQLFFNFMWTLIFFKLQLRFFAFGWLVAMWLMILVLIILAFRNQKTAAWLLIPYIIWCTFAAYLNIMIAVLN